MATVTFDSTKVYGSIALSNGNVTALCVTGSSYIATNEIKSTTGKYYVEFVANTTGIAPFIGIFNPDTYTLNGNFPPYSNDVNSIITTNYPNTNSVDFTVGKVISMLIDIDGKTVQFYVNGIYALSKTFNFNKVNIIYGCGTIGGSSGNATITANFGAIPFAYPIPTGFCAYQEITKYLIQDKNSILYTYNGSDIIESLSQTLDDINFKENGFNDPLIITEEQWNVAFPDKTGLQLLKWTDDINITESTIICNIESYSYKPIDQFGENKILGASFFTTDNKIFTVDPLTNVPFKQNSVVCYKDGIEVTPDEINYDEGIVTFYIEQIGIITFDYTYIVPFDILLYKPN